MQKLCIDTGVTSFEGKETAGSSVQTVLVAWFHELFQSNFLLSSTRVFLCFT